MNLIKENPRRASEESVTVTRSGENKRGNESLGVFKRQMLSDCTDPPDLQVSKLTEFVYLFLECKPAVKNDSKVTSCIGKWDVTLAHT